MQIFHNPNYNFVKYRWHALVVSWVLILAGLVMIWTTGIPLGVEFSGGTQVVLQFDQQRPSIDQVRTALDKHFPGGGQNVVVQTYGTEVQREILVRVPHTGKESGTELTRTADEIQAAVRAGGLGAFKVAGTEVVGPVVGQELASKGTWAFLLSLFFILLYLWFRFELSFAVGATVATLHDILITMALLMFFRYEMSLNIIAALLTMTGYSTNDTIVIFDRVRENLRGMRRDNIKDIVNVAVNQTLNRTIITGGTALLSVIALYFFGGEVLRGFAFTMIVGIITGTYSSVFIAAAIVTFWRHGKGGARIVAASAAMPAAQRPTTTARQRKGSRNGARAS
ncbi:MAG TPA: protein translocase subunit SecF [Vicinamibacterales bacterium]|jgi:preprotein translocase subunit SecF